tara:strand:+ start:184 stop:438 length:255 start_codon:yes stop_codon:yes gene_type:complete
MNDKKEEFVKKECFRAAALLYGSLLKERRALRFDMAKAPDEIYKIAMALFNDGKKRYWATYSDMDVPQIDEEERKDHSPHDTDG